MQSSNISQDTIQNKIKHFRDILACGNSKDLEMIRLQGFDILIRFPYYDFTRNVLHISAYNEKNPQVIRALLAENKKRLEIGKDSLDINEKDGYGHTPLFIAAKRGNLNVIYALIDFGATIHKDFYNLLEKYSHGSLIYHINRYLDKNKIAASQAAENTSEEKTADLPEKASFLPSTLSNCLSTFWTATTNNLTNSDLQTSSLSPSLKKSQ